MTNKKELSKEELEQVSGGDCDDNEIEWSPTPEGVKYLYEVGQEVEVYNTGFQVSTKRKRILDRKPYELDGGWVGSYKFQKNDEYEWLLADDIER